jgi:hypothetical protein
MPPVRTSPRTGLTAQGKVSEIPKTRYFYDPHLPALLRFDETGEHLNTRSHREPMYG